MRIKTHRLVITALAILFIIMLINRFEILQVSFYPVVKNIEKLRVLKYTDNFETLETEHFIIRYEKEDEYYAEFIGDTLDKYYYSICNMYNYYPSDKSAVIIYNNEEDFLKNLRFDKGNTPLGAYYSGTINILSPRIWISDKEKLNEIYEVSGTAIHEFAHLLVDDITKGNYPMWLTEGLALYTEYEIKGFEWPSYSLDNNEITFEDLEKRFNDIDQNVAYRKSFEVVKEISDNLGFEKLRNMLTILGEGNNIDRSAKVALKTNIFELKSFD